MPLMRLKCLLFSNFLLLMDINLHLRLRTLLQMFLMLLHQTSRLKTPSKGMHAMQEVHFQRLLKNDFYFTTFKMEPFVIWASFCATLQVSSKTSSITVLTVSPLSICLCLTSEKERLCEGY